MNTTPTFTEIVHAPHWQKFISNGTFVFVGDIGGTNSNFGLIEISSQPTLCMSFHAKSQHVPNFADLCVLIINHVYKRYNVSIARVCIGAAGPISQQRSRVAPTNLSVVIDTHDIIRALPDLKECVLINDFEAVGLGIGYIDPTAIITIHEGKGVAHAQKACIGAGTGLGKVALLWNDRAQYYLPLASEGGHGDCSAQSDQEYDFFKFFRTSREWTCPVSWEHVLSGDGISALYQFLTERTAYPSTRVREEIRAAGFKPDLISRYAHEDACCYDTFTMYARFYARCAKNFALDALAQNGLYIAGGIAAKNVRLFASEHFKDNFFACGKQRELLERIPLFVITDYNISLYGAAAFLLLRDQGVI